MDLNGFSWISNFNFSIRTANLPVIIADESQVVAYNFYEVVQNKRKTL